MSKHSVLIQWSEEDTAFIATVPELEGLSAFGSTPEKTVKELSIAKKLYLDVLEEDGEEVPEPDILKPFSGQIRLRLPKSLHASLSNAAKKEGISFNTYVVQLLSERNSLRLIKREIESLTDKVYSQMTAYSPVKERVEKLQVSTWGKEEININSKTYLH
ncbi:MAG: toxin-antitoxin system HicB family antitoxin [Thermodesulfobacteriota bacterium]